MAVVGAVMVPHPPLILPEVGRGAEKEIAETARAYEAAADFAASLEPETVVLSSPHSVMYSDYLHISPGTHAEGDMARFGAPQVRVAREYDEELSERICALAKEAEIPAGYLGERDPALDHATIVPLYFILKKWQNFRLVRLGISGISLADHYRLGMLVQQAAEELGRRVVYVASGDLSHKLKANGPYGFDPHGPVYDDKIMDVCGRADFEKLLEFDPVLLEKAAECGHRSFVIMAGALDRLAVEPHRLCHQDVTGVGYGVCTYRVTGRDAARNFLDQYEAKEKERLRQRRVKEDPYVALARETVEVFVSLHIAGELRGCIGTISPVRRNIAEEIVNNAISACSRDPRFDPVREEELPYLEYGVDVLDPPEDIASPAQLDVKKYGVIVSRGERRGLLLPNLEGVDDVQEQIRIARKKAGIPDFERDVKLQRFQVVRHE